MKFIVLSAFLAVAFAQRNYVDPRNAAILQEARYLNGDGQFGSAYVQEDGTQFKEETQSDGTRAGQYSYIDPQGKTITVMYTAGKNGFQVSGDHLPKAPIAPQVPAIHQRPAPVPQYNTQPQYNTVQTGGCNPAEGDYCPHLINYNEQSGPVIHNYQTPSNPIPQQPLPQFNNYQQQQQLPFTTTTTPAPNRFFPPGKLSLNRRPDGYEYSFSSQ